MTKVILYWAEWCGHCIRFKPEWEKIKKELTKLGVTVEDYEHSRDSQVINDENINGFPTIKIKKGSSTKEYTGERTLEGIKKELKLQSGGKVDYYAKYMKYKSKYLELKNKLN